jgi:hypothetical protein
MPEISAAGLFLFSIFPFPVATRHFHHTYLVPISPSRRKERAYETTKGVLASEELRVIRPHAEG